jgi:hypothetical protein
VLRTRKVQTTVAFLTGVALIAAALPAYAIQLASCTGTATTVASPPITSTPQTITFTTTINYPLCVTLGFPFVLSAQTVEVQFVPVPIACDDIADGLGSLSSNEQGPFQITIQWSDGQQSIFDASGSITTVEELVQVTSVEGSISSGKFAGASAMRQNVYPVSDLECSIDGSLETINGTSILTLTPP